MKVSDLIDLLCEKPQSRNTYIELDSERNRIVFWHDADFAGARFGEINMETQKWAHRHPGLNRKEQKEC